MDRKEVAREKGPRKFESGPLKKRATHGALGWAGALRSEEVRESVAAAGGGKEILLKVNSDSLSRGGCRVGEEGLTDCNTSSICGPDCGQTRLGGALGEEGKLQS